MAGRRIVILCDGTSNEIESDRSNILRLYGTLAKNEEQLVYYDPGVGTFGAANAWSYGWRKTTEVWGLATGWGLDQNVKEAYRFLAETYDDGKTSGRPADEIFLFGFSRGAYTVRVLAGFIHAIGLMAPINLNLIDYAYRAYKSVSDRTENDNRDERDPTLNPFAEVRLYERILQPRRPAIRCLGLFDTVGSVIERGRGWPRLRTHAFTKTNRSVESVRHAVAIDEKRTMFQPILWPAGVEYWGGPFKRSSAKQQDVSEVWFSGVHGDVGGGYPETHSKLAKIPLDWMINETKAMGLKYKTRTVNELVLGKNDHKDYVKPDPLAAPNVSMNAGWNMVEFWPRRRSPFRETRRAEFMGLYLPRSEMRIIPAGASIHASVFKRRGTPADYQQPNIPADHEVKGGPARRVKRATKKQVETAD
ncbi:MAG: DUF2235 domain-containing protein [Pseudomonadota bacterium]